MHKERSFNLFIIDDSLADINLMREGIRRSGLGEIAVPYSASNWDDAFHILESCYQNGIFFHIILLDLNMPKVNGKEVLRRIRKDSKYAALPVFIISNSDNLEDIKDCIRLGADAYFQKPQDFTRLVDFFSAVKHCLELAHDVSVPILQRYYAELKTGV